MSFTAADVKSLRDQTGAGMMACKEALKESSGNVDKAVDYLRKKGLAAAAKKQSRVAAEGSIGTYVHGGKIGVLVEVNCETDFVAKSDDFKNFVKEVAMHIAASDPKFVASSDIDEGYKNKEAEIYAAQLKEEGKPENMIDKIVQGKLNKLASEICLLEQKWIKDQDKTIQDLINDLTLKLGEKLSIRRFTKYNLGEGIEKKADNLADEVAKMTAKN